MMLGAGFCLAGMDHITGGDLCISFLMATLQVLLVFALIPTDQLLPSLARIYRRYPPDLPAPPPKA